jgi:hypothetical protein
MATRSTSTSSATANTIATPSARSRERVTGRWTYEVSLTSHTERLIYYVKLIVGTPIPWLLWSFIAFSFASRSGVEITSWTCALLTFFYIAADRLSGSREFKTFRIGADLFLLGYLLVAIVGAFLSDSIDSGIATLGGARWVILLYLITYCIELFPGLNRLFTLMSIAAISAAAYAIWQHFTGVDLLRSIHLHSAPTKDEVYFVPTGLFNAAHILATVLAMALPFPVATFLMAEKKESSWQTWMAIPVSAVLALAILWTYRPGIWLAAIVSLMILGILQGRRFFSFALTFTAILALMILTSYSNPQGALSAVQAEEEIRTASQRTQINSQVALWQESMWLGAGRKSLEAVNYDAGTGNAYFQVLAQSGFLGGFFYILFLLSFLLVTYKLLQEIPKTHYWHRVIVGGALASQIAFHVSGLYWSTLADSLTMNLFVVVIAAVSYLNHHYSRGLVPDDQSL